MKAENFTTRELEKNLQHMIKHSFEAGHDCGTHMNGCAISLELFVKNAIMTVTKDGKKRKFNVAYTAIAKNGFSADAEKIAKFINA